MKSTAITRFGARRLIPTKLVTNVLSLYDVNLICVDTFTSKQLFVMTTTVTQCCIICCYTTQLEVKVQCKVKLRSIAAQ